MLGARAGCLVRNLSCPRFAAGIKEHENALKTPALTGPAAMLQDQSGVCIYQWPSDFLPAMVPAGSRHGGVP